MIVPSRLLSLSTHNESLKIHIFLNKYLKYSKIWSLTVSRLFQLLVIVSQSVFLVVVRSPNNIFNKHVCSCYLKSFKTKKHYFDSSYSINDRPLVRFHRSNIYFFSAVYPLISSTQILFYAIYNAIYHVYAIYHVCAIYHVYAIYHVCYPYVLITQSNSTAFLL